MSWDYHECKCGQPYIVYVPKKLILEEGKGFGPEIIKAAEKIDERERKSGEIEVIKKIAKNIGAKFYTSKSRYYYTRRRPKYLSLY